MRHDLAGFPDREIEAICSSKDIQMNSSFPSVFLQTTSTSRFKHATNDYAKFARASSFMSQYQFTN